MRNAWPRILLATADLLISVATVLAGLIIRFAFEDGPIPGPFLAVYWSSLPLLLLPRLLIFWAVGLYRVIWSLAGLPELLRVVWAVTLDAALSSLIIYQLAGGKFARSVFIIAWLLTLGAMTALRLLLRIRRRLGVQPAAQPVRRTLIFGAGVAGSMLARELDRHPNLGHLVGFLDDDRKKHGYLITGRPVLGTRADLERVVTQHRVTHMIIAAPSMGKADVREIVELGRRLGLQLKTLPGLYELLDGRLSVSQIRDVQIEDLLGRQEIKVDLEAIAAYLQDEVVLVTGAGGSIGSELCRQIARFQPRQLILLGHGENSIYAIHLELERTHPGLALRPVIADIQDEARIRAVFRQSRPGVVFHAAAHKHVPLMEANPEEAIKNNVFGTLHVARAAHEFEAKRFVLISSDKAVNPTSIMGATKRMAEFIIRARNAGSTTAYMAVRFGNVLGSRGSVVPLFKQQIAEGGPVTITDPRMVRYFMTIPEAVQLVIQAGSMGAGGEVFVLDMGEPVPILDLARDLIRLSGFEPEVDIPLLYTGIRPGEKLFEELLTTAEGTSATRHERVFCAGKAPIAQEAVDRLLGHLRELYGTEQLTNPFLTSLVRSFEADEDRDRQTDHEEVPLC